MRGHFNCEGKGFIKAKLEKNLQLGISRVVEGSNKKQSEGSMDVFWNIIL